MHACLHACIHTTIAIVTNTAIANVTTMAIAIDTCATAPSACTPARDDLFVFQGHGNAIQEPDGNW